MTRILNLQKFLKSEHFSSFFLWEKNWVADAQELKTFKIADEIFQKNAILFWNSILIMVPFCPYFQRFRYGKNWAADAQELKTFKIADNFFFFYKMPSSKMPSWSRQRPWQIFSKCLLLATGCSLYWPGERRRLNGQSCLRSSNYFDTRIME